MLASQHPAIAAPKDVFVVATVESESEFTEVERQIFLAHIAVRAEIPRLKRLQNPSIVFV